MKVYSNKIYLLYHSDTSTFGSESTDIVLDIIDLRTGLKLSTKTYGSTEDDSALSMEVNHFGVSIIANIGDGFADSNSVDSYSTQNSLDNFAIVFCDYDGNIHEVESYDTTDAANDLGAGYPLRLVIGRLNKHEPLYTFIGYRYNENSFMNGGVYITQVADQQALFVTGNTLATCSSVSANCELCHTNVCFKCEDGYKVQDGICKATCDDHYFHQHDDTDNTKDIDICLPCHETCLTCFDGTATGCFTCDSGRVFDSTYNTCSCDSSLTNKYLGLTGTCVSSWDFGLAAIKNNEWYKTCPQNSDSYSSSIQSTPRDKSSDIACYDLDKHLYFKENTTSVTSISKPVGYWSDIFTLSFWIYIESTSFSKIPVFAYGNMFKANLLRDSSNNFALQLEIYNISDNTVSTQNSSYSFSMSEWVYWSISLYDTTRLSNSFTINIVTKTKSLVESQQSINKDMIFSCSISNESAKYFHIGQTSLNTKAKFTGYMNLITVISEPQSIEEMLSNYDRVSLEWTMIYDKRLLLNIVVKPTNDYATVINYATMYSKLEIDPTSNMVQIKDLPSDPLTSMCQTYHINTCVSVSTREMPRFFITKHNVFKNLNLVEDGSFNFETDDLVVSIQNNVFLSPDKIVGLCYRDINIGNKMTAIYDGSHFEPTYNVTEEIGNGFHYNHELLYYNRSAHGDLIYLGKIHKVMTIPSIYPNRGQSKLGDTILVDIDLTYRMYSYKHLMEDYSTSYYDEFISFSLDWDDVQVGDVKIQRQPDGTFEQLDTSLFSAAGHYLMCWKPPFIDYESYLLTYQSFWDVTEVPKVTTLIILYEQAEYPIYQATLKGTLALNDEFQIYTEGGSDCDPAFRIYDTELNRVIYYTGSTEIYIWLPDSDLEMHICWRTKSNGLYTAFERVNYSSGSNMIIEIPDDYTYPNVNPKIFDFSHKYGAVLHPDESFWFSFANSTEGYPEVIPSQNPTNASDFGKFTIYDLNRYEYVVNVTNLTHVNNEPNQGSLLCHKAGEQEGKCFVDVDFQSGQSVVITFFSNSFSYSDGTNRHYLFGETDETLKIYHHSIWWENHLIQESDFAINSILRVDIGDFINSCDPILVDKWILSLSYGSVQIIESSFYVVGQTWENPTGSINPSNKENNTVYITNFDLKNCTQGDVYGSFDILYSPKLDSSSFNYYLTEKDVFLGTIGCHETCKTCDGVLETDCIECSDEYPFYNIIQETCIEECSDIQVFYYGVDYQAWLENCPQHYYKDASNIWKKWHGACLSCSGPSITDWTECNFPDLFLLDETWVDEWPADLYEADLESYKWVESNYYNQAIVDSTPEWQTSSPYSHDNLKLSIDLVGVSAQVMIIPGGTLEMVITNMRGNITLTKFTQVEPIPDPNTELTNLFPLLTGATNQYLNETVEVELNVATINNYVDGTIFKVKAEVENDWGDKAISFIQFSKNPPPTIGTATVSCSSSPCRVLEQVSITLDGDWYASDISMMDLYIKVELQVLGHNSVLIIPELWQETEFSFIMPVLSLETDENMAVDLLITAVNIFSNTNTLTESITVNNTLGDDYGSVMYSSSIDTTDMPSLALLAAQMKLTLNVPTNKLYAEYVCVRDSDWPNGAWVNLGQYCQPYNGYMGIDTTMTYGEFAALSRVINDAIRNLNKKMQQSASRSSTQMIIEVLSSLLIRPEVYSFANAEYLPNILESFSELNNQYLLAFGPYTDKAFINSISRFYSKVSYESKYMMRYSNETEFSSAYFYLSYFEKLLSIQSQTITIWQAVERYLAAISNKVTADNQLFVHETEAGLFKIEYMIASSVNGSEYTIHADKSWTVTFPSDLFDGSSLTDLTSSVKVISIYWYLSPLFVSEVDEYSIVSDPVSIFLVDSEANLIDISSKEIKISTVFSNSSALISDNLSWKSFRTLESSQNLTGSLWNLVLDIDSSCKSCSATLTASHLSTFMIVETNDFSVQAQEYEGVGTEKKYIQKETKLSHSWGFMIVMSLIMIYTLGSLVLWTETNKS